MAGHLWVLSKLLSMEASDNEPRNPINITNRLLPYVIATCYMKIKHRLKNTLSKAYIQALKAVEQFDFDESKRHTPTAMEIDNDNLFMFQHVLLADMPGIEIPKLIEQARLAEQKKVFQLYSKETSMEFHQVLLYALQRLSTLLDNLEKTRGSAKTSTKANNAFKATVILVKSWGVVIQRLAKTSVLKMHLKQIAPLLRAKHLGPQMPTPTPDPGEEQEEVDQELKALQSLETEKAYINWLRLLVVHFDSVNILVQ